MKSALFGPNTLSEVLLSKGPAPAKPVELPDSCREALRQPQSYIPNPDLIDAVSVALELRQPLLVTGEPGTGKTRLADFVALRLGLEAPIQFRVKSTSVAQELLYTYDAVGRFNARRREDLGDDAVDVRPFIKYGALGRAILLANEKQAVQKFLPPSFEHPGAPRLSVVLIDEIDKAPRDFPNDFLGELDEMRFTVPEIDPAAHVRAAAKYLPVVIVTSNSEKDLPEAFLRRCVYYHIEFPDADALEEIVAARLKDVLAAGAADSNLVKHGVQVFDRLRKERDSFQKPPGTSELIEWLIVLHRMRHGRGGQLELGSPDVERSLGSLFKNENDLKRGTALFREKAQQPFEA